jgi:sulfate transport system substrate-binding protein
MRDGRRIVAVIALLLFATGCGRRADVELLNVSYDPTRELWRDLNKAFIDKYQRETGKTLAIEQSHGGSSSQARAVIDGLPADVVTLALWNDTDAVRKKGLIKDGWEDRLPEGSLPYYSTIVFVVRKGNPKKVRDWPDLVREDIKIITPSPKTSGNGRLSFLAGWGAMIHAGKSKAAARDFITELYRRVPVLDSAARGATTTFAQKKIGDVHLSWENEAHLEVKEAKGELEIVYPSASIRAEPYIAVVDANVDRRGTREVAEAYLKSLYAPGPQEIIARHHYRPIDKKVLARHKEALPPITLFPVTILARDWDDAHRKFFTDGAIFDQIYQPSGK